MGAYWTLGYIGIIVNRLYDYKENEETENKIEDREWELPIGVDFLFSS